MLDTYNVKSAPAYPQEVHEHRAPTDQSVGLLREMEKTAEARVLSSHTLEDNRFHATWHIIRDWSVGFDVRVRCQLSLNGKDHTFEFTDDGARMRDKGAMAAEIHKRVVERIAAILTVDLFRECRDDLIR